MGVTSARSGRASIHGWLLVTPALFLLATFTYWPILGSIVHSLYETPRKRQIAKFVGLANYDRLLADPVFIKVLVNNLIFAAGTIVPSIVIAIIMALWVDSQIRWRGLLRLAYFLPTMLPMIAAANIWLFFYTPNYGLLDQILAPFGLGENNWLGNSNTVLACIMVMTVWKEAGFFMIFYLAALQQIQPELHEAASIDGASRFYFFRRVTFPVLMPTTLFVLINATINSFKLVDHIIVMTKGGPDNASSLLLYYLYETAFSFWDTSYASVLTVVLLVILSIVAIGQFVVLDSRTHYR